MCGITGILNFDKAPVSPVVIKGMCDAILHRGPDDQGTFVEEYVGLGNRRLSILDLSDAGRQPMTTADGRFVIVYNGELYNFQALRVELQGLGYSFHSNTDTEVVLKAYARWGARCLERFNGMFGIAIWDRRDKTLFLARDRYGIKPLYYTKLGKNLLFGSEIKTFFPHPDFRTRLNSEALLEYFTFQNFFTQNTLFEDVTIVPAGTYLLISVDHPDNTQPIMYWDFHFQEPESPASDAEYLEELDRLFKQAVQRQLISDVPVGSYLSGGMDSGSITAIAAQQISNLKTYTIGFDLHSASGIELAFDEREKAEYMSYLFKTEHYEMVLKAGDMERVFPKLVWHIEEPRVGQSYPNFYAAKLAGKFGKVVLSGAGGDELFGGYPWRYYRAVVNNSFDEYIDKYYSFWQRLLTPAEQSHVFAPIWSQVSHVKPKEIFRSIFKTHDSEFTRPEDYINHSLYLETKTFLHGLLVIEDKLSMANSLETRVPFLDNDLVDFAMQVPTRLKLGNLKEVISLNENEPGNKTAKYFEKTKDGKLLLRKAMQKYIPEKITGREKQGFSGPDASWFKGESIEYVRQKLYNPKARIYDFMDRKSVQSIVNDHLEGRQNKRLLIWSLLNMEHWCEIFLQQSPKIDSSISMYPTSACISS